MSAAGKTRVAVLGGGVAGMVTAFELTATPELRAAHDVTVYQMGWRLGGKGASGRNARLGSRIEEHGLHIWFGFYDNAFNVMRRCYDELARSPQQPLATFDDAFKPTSQIVLGEQYADRWLLWPFDAPRNPLTPGGDHVLPTFWEMVRSGLDSALSAWASLAADFADLAHRSPRRHHWPRLVEEAAGALREAAAPVEHASHVELLRAARALAHHLCSSHEPDHPGLICRILRECRQALWEDLVQHHLDHDRLRLFFTTFDTMSAIAVGVIEDELISKGFDSIDDEELRDWLARHGTNAFTLEDSPVIRGWYDAAFAYAGGDVRKPNLAAGTAVHGLLRMVFTYHGAISWKMQAGMGDTIFTPLYEVLQKRGVTFEFFHRVTHVGLSADRRSVAGVDIVRQARIEQAPYRPLVEVQELGCWPSEPDWDQLVDGVALREAGLNFEYGDDEPHGEPVRLEVGRDLDVVVLAIPVGAHAAICPELIADPDHPAFGAMVANTKTVMTQAFQVWQSTPLKRGLGWPYRDASILTSYVEPVDTFCDMSHLLVREAWPTSADVSDIAYFCGVLADEDGDSQESATERAYRSALAFLTGDLGPLWPRSEEGALRGYDWDLLVDLESRTGPERLRSQFWRANFQPTERYVLTVAGSTKYRLAADESGWPNLVLAGDWVRTSINGGCVEAATMAGMQAARAISGQPTTIVGESWEWLERARP